MKTYKITMTPICHKTALVKADSMEEAIHIAEGLYERGELAFGPIAVDDVEFMAEERKRGRDYER